MNRNEIDTKYQWDSSHLYPTMTLFDKDYTEANRLFTKLVSEKDTFYTSSQNLIAFLEDETMLNRLLSKLYLYAHLNVDVDPNNQENRLLEAKVMSLYQNIMTQLNFIDNKLLENSESIEQFLTLEEFEDYRYQMNEILRYKDHILDQEMEDILSNCEPVMDTGSEVFDAFRLDFKPVHVNGKEEFLNSGTLNKFLKSKNPKVRKEAYDNFFEQYQKYENVFATTLSSDMKKDAAIAKIRHYSSSLEASLFADDVPTELFFKIVDFGTNEYIHLFHRYNRLKKKILHLDTIYNYDLNVPLVQSTSHDYTLNEAWDLVFEATKPLGKEYHDILMEAKDNRWVDYYPHANKQDGAYSTGCYDSHPYILMNYIGDYNSVSTLIHELGHSCHTYLSNKYQKPQNSQYRIFVAEVASTVNEMLLIRTLMKNPLDKQEKANIYYNFLEECVGLIFRQPFYANFEHRLHQMAENHEPMASENITSLYHKLNEEYFGEDVTLSPYLKYSCYYIPHFYYNYYVYKYTLGMTCALAISSRIMDGDEKQVNQYLKFLKSGGSASPIELLKIAGVDPLDDKLYHDSYHIFETMLDEFEALLDKE